MPVALTQSVVTAPRAVRPTEGMLRKERNGVAVPSASSVSLPIDYGSSAMVIFLLTRVRSECRDSTLLIPWGFLE